MKRWELLLRTIIEEERPLPWNMEYIGAPLANLDTAFKRYMLRGIATTVWGAEIKREADGDDHVVYTILAENEVIGRVSLWRLSQCSCDLKVLVTGKNDEMVKQCVIAPLYNWLVQNGNDENDWPNFWEADATRPDVQPENKSDPKPNLIDQLSDREKEVLQQIVNGLGQTQTAEKLGVAAATIKVHKRSINQKLGLLDDAKDEILRNYGLANGMKRL